MLIKPCTYFYERYPATCKALRLVLVIFYRPLSLAGASVIFFWRLYYTNDPYSTSQDEKTSLYPSSMHIHSYSL